MKKKTIKFVYRGCFEETLFLGHEESSIFTAQKAFKDGLIIFSLFTQNLVLSEEFLYKFELVK